MDLFDAAATDPAGTPAPGPEAPLAVRMRPRTLDEVVGQDHLVRPGSPLRALVDPGERRVAPSSLVLVGPPGTGKTTLAYLVAGAGNRHFVELSAVSAGVRDVRAAVEAARRALLGGRETVLFIDEVHRFSKAQQDALLPSVENRWVTLVAATTENPSFSVISPLLSRSLVLTLRPLDAEALSSLVARALVDPRGLAGAVTLEDAALEHLLRLAGADARKALTILEAAAGAAVSGAGAATAPGVGPARVDLATVERAVDVAAVRYDRAGDQHYDVTSAFIKSMRGSDVDAALHYLARMLAAGEDPRFVARRVMIAAAEDVGLADPTALGTAVAAAQAVALVGMPEARIILAEAVVHVATAPKSNAVYRAVDAALADVRAGHGGPVPAHLRDAHYAGAKSLGHGVGYVSPHDVPAGVVAQRYAPDDLLGTRYYAPSGRGHEREVAARLERIRQALAEAPAPGAVDR